MNIFKTKSIVLHIKKNSEKEYIYTIFSEDYGKCLIQKQIKNTEKPLDIGYIFNAEILTKENRDIHKVKNIKIKSQFNYEGQSYEQISHYLSCIEIIFKEVPVGISAKEIFEIVEMVNTTTNISPQNLTLAKLKITALLGNLPETYGDDEILSKILKFINHSKFEKIVKLQALEDDMEEKLKKLT